MRFLISSLTLLLVGCASYPRKMGFTAMNLTATTVTNEYFSNTNKDYLYKAKVNIFNTSFGGILVIKKSAARAHRIVFTTELGNTIFDFSIVDEEFKINRILKELDRKILLNILEKDFKTLIHEQAIITKNYTDDNDSIAATTIYGNPHFYTYGKGQLKHIAQVGGQKEKVVFLFSEISNNIANHIQINHKNLKLQIELKAFE